MKINRTKNAKRNIVAGLFNKIVTLLLPFLVRTAFIYSLGSQYLGLNSLFTSILTVLNMTELGLSSAIVFSMYEPIANDDNNLLCALLNFYRKAYRNIGLIIMLIGLTLIPFLPNLINGECPDELNIYILYLLYLSNTVISYMLFAYKKSILEAFQRKDIISWIDTLTIGMTNVVQLLLLLFWHDIRVYYLYVFTLLCFTLLNNIISAIMVDRKYPQFICSGSLPKKTKDIIKKQVSGVMVNKICQMTRNSLDSIFVSAFIGLTMTTIYNNYYYVLNAVVGFTTIFTNAMTAGIGNSIAIESSEKNYTDFNKFNFMYMWIAGWASITMLCLYQNFMLLWVGEELTLPFGISVLFSIYFYALKIGDIRATYSSAAGLWWENRYRAIIEVIANIVLNYIFVKLWGVYGIVIATIVPILSINNIFGMNILNKYYFKVKHGTMIFFKKNILYLAVTLIAGIVTYYFCSFLGNSVVNLFEKAAICISVPNLLFLMIYSRNTDFLEAKKWIIEKFRKK